MSNIEVSRWNKNWNIGYSYGYVAMATTIRLHFRFPRSPKAAVDSHIRWFQNWTIVSIWIHNPNSLEYMISYCVQDKNNHDIGWNRGGHHFVSPRTECQQSSSYDLACIKTDSDFDGTKLITPPQQTRHVFFEGLWMISLAIVNLEPIIISDAPLFKYDT